MVGPGKLNKTHLNLCQRTKKTKHLGVLGSNLFVAPKGSIKLVATRGNGLDAWAYKGAAFWIGSDANGSCFLGPCIRAGSVAVRFENLLSIWLCVDMVLVFSESCRVQVIESC